ncbi:MAG: HAMP domain-containing sensor histidine kinase [Gemmatimonadales bacterium]|nr:HAMP domain-containing sensor histidine kinase [Gemmatimonadales bacterium]
MRSIRATLTLWYTVALAATVLTFGVTITILERRSNFDELDRRLTAVADVEGGILAAEQRAGGALIEESSDPYVAQLRLDAQERLDPIPGWVIVVDSAARGVYGSAEVRRFTPAASDVLRRRVFRVVDRHETFTVDLDRTRFRFVARRVTEAGPAIVAVAVGEPTRDLDIAPRRLLTSMLLVAPLILVFAAGIGYLLSVRALRPVARIIDELEAITDGRSLHRRLPAPLSQVDELGRLASSLNSLLGRLEASFGAMRRFVADASHELKTPLTVMRAGVERALTDPATAPEAMVQLEETLQEVRRMTELVDALLTLARVDEGRMELHRETVDLGDLLGEVHETAQLLGEAAGVAAILEVPPEPVTVDADRDRIRQLAMNLAINAVKYTPAGGQVWLTLTAAPKSASISVRDTGIGIAPGDVGRVFDRFWRADPARSRTGERPGIGLGLSISKWIAEAHGGSIAVTSRPGRGSTFTVTLPLASGSIAAVTES